MTEEETKRLNREIERIVGNARNAKIAIAKNTDDPVRQDEILSQVDAMPSQAAVGTEELAHSVGYVGRDPSKIPLTSAEEAADEERVGQHSLKHIWSLYKAYKKELDGDKDPEFLIDYKSALTEALERATPEAKELMNYDPGGQEAFKQMLSTLAEQSGGDEAGLHAIGLRSLDDRRTITAHISDDTTVQDLQRGLEGSLDLRDKFLNEIERGTLPGENIGTSDHRLSGARSNAERYGNYVDEFQRLIDLRSN